MGAVNLVIRAYEVPSPTGLIGLKYMFANVLAILTTFMETGVKVTVY